MTELFRYRCKYRRDGDHRVYHVTVTASGTDDARRIVAIRDPEFASTIETPRRGKRVVLEEPDGMDQAKAREFATWRDTEVEVA